MKRIYLLAPFILGSALFLGACSAPPDAPKNAEDTQQAVSNPEQSTNNENGEAVEELVQVKKSDVEALKEDNESKADYIESLEKELKYYKNYAESISNTMTEDKLQILIDKEWSYTLSVNGISFPKNGLLEMAASDFELILKEEKAPYSVLSEENQQKGRIKSALTQAISTNAGETKLKEQDLIQEIVISYKGLEKGSTVSIKIHEDLQKKLGLETTDLKIQLK